MASANDTKLINLTELDTALRRAKEELHGTVYKATKATATDSDTKTIEDYFKLNTNTPPKPNDVFIVEQTAEGLEGAYSPYIYDGETWIALVGAGIDADKVILQDDIIMAGNYTQVGNQTKTQNGTATFATKGKSVAEVLTEIFSKRLQPAITAQPSIGTFTLTGAGAVEAGTKLTTASYSAATLNAGSYTYGPATGVVAQSWTVDRVTNAGTTQVATQTAASLTAGTDNNAGSGFVIGDQGGTNVVSSLKYKVTATHGAGVVAKDNLGSNSSPEVKIAAGTKTKETSAYTPYRNYFYGSSATKPAVNSNYIRTLTKSNKAYVAGTITINVKAGDQRVCIACINGKTGVTKVINESAMNADVTSTFVKTTGVAVEGASGYTAQNYNVWVYEPAKPYENPATLKVTLG